MLKQSLIVLLKGVRDSAKDCGKPVFLIGGTLRDLLIQAAPYDKDFDFVVEGDAIACARCAKNRLGGVLTEHPNFITAKLSGLQGYDPITEIDFASARKETYPKPGMLPEVTSAGLDEDLGRRDFSINALAVSLSDYIQWLVAPTPTPQTLEPLILDKFSGIRDLKDRIVRILHSKSFIDDPTRIFRAARYVTRIRGRLDPKTEEALRDAVCSGACDTLSVFRKMTEIRKICGEANPGIVFNLLLEWGVFSTIPFSPGVLDQVKTLWNGLSQFSEREGEETRYEAFLHLCLALTPAAEREKYGALLGLGKKKVIAIGRNDSRALNEFTIKDLPDSALIARSLLAQGPDLAFCQKELKKRNLLLEKLP